MYFQAKCEVKISQLSYADDVIIFTNCKEAGLLRLMNFLRKFEEQSGQQINQAKSAFIIPGRKANLIANRIKNITGFSMKALPITYLGAPLYKGNKRKVLYEPDKVRNRISVGKTATSYGGCLLLIKTVLSSMPIYLLQVLNPPVSTIQKLEDFLQDSSGAPRQRGKFTGLSGITFAFPPMREDLALEIFGTVSAFSYKLWWRLRLNNSLWSTFTISKYCQGYFPGTSKVFTTDEHLEETLHDPERSTREHILELRYRQCLLLARLVASGRLLRHLNWNTMQPPHSGQLVLEQSRVGRP
ncbi:UNVERIFIED_CONTAM: hypothetical protein Scaly_3084900 [Sesamum calycinum]|uniref:Reverse transcriptase domain-containing protein n=1 Tax=Sesamum calycinum TaxID=2727403 RepID=A0AAW2JP55_9LAMI